MSQQHLFQIALVTSYKHVFVHVCLMSLDWKLNNGRAVSILAILMSLEAGTGTTVRYLLNNYLKNK